MLTTIIRLATGRWVLASLLTLAIGGAALFQLGPYPNLVSLNQNKPLPEEQLASVDTTFNFLEKIGRQGRVNYAQFQIVDLINPLLISTFLTLTIGWLLKLANLAKQLKLIVALPLLIVVAEVWENTLLYLAATDFPNVSSSLPTLEYAQSMKFIALGVSFVVLILMAGTSIFRIIMARRGTR